MLPAAQTIDGETELRYFPPQSTFRGANHRVSRG